MTFVLYISFIYSKLYLKAKNEEAGNGRRRDGLAWERRGSQISQGDCLQIITWSFNEGLIKTSNETQASHPWLTNHTLVFMLDLSPSLSISLSIYICNSKQACKPIHSTSCSVMSDEGEAPCLYKLQKDV